MQCCRQSSRHALTLLEVMIVVALLSLLTAVLFAVRRGRGGNAVFPDGSVKMLTSGQLQAFAGSTNRLAIP